MTAKRALLAGIIAYACLIVAEGGFAQKQSEDRAKRSEKQDRSGERRESRSADRQTKSANESTRAARDRSSGGSASSRRGSATGSASSSSRSKGGGDAQSRQSRERTSSGRSGRRGSQRNPSEGRAERARDRGDRTRTSDDSHSTDRSEWRDAGSAADRRGRGTNYRRRADLDRDRERARRRDDSDRRRTTIYKRPYRRRKPRYRPPEPCYLEYDHCCVYEEHIWITEITEIHVSIYEPIYLPVGVLIPEEIDPAVLDKIDSLLAVGLGDERLVCILQMTEPFEGYELYELFEESDDFAVLRKLTDRAFIIRAAAYVIFDIIEHPLVGWIDEYRSAYKYRPDGWDTYRYTYLYLMERGCPDYVKELGHMDISILRSPDPYASRYCVLADGKLVSQLADLWWVYEVAVDE